MLAERIGETLSGETAPFFVSVFGNDLDTDDAVAARIAAVLKRLPHASEVRLQVPPRAARAARATAPRAAGSVRAADRAMCCRRSTRRTTAASSASSREADRSVPVAVRIAGAGGLAAGGWRAAAARCRRRRWCRCPRSRSSRWSPAAAMIDHEDGLRRQVVTANPTTSDQTGFAAAARRAIARPGATAVRRVSALWRRGRGAGRRGAPALPACRRGAGADRAADGAGVRARAARGAGAVGVAEHADRRRRRRSHHRRDADAGRDGGLRRAVRHGGAQHHPAGVALTTTW